MFEYFVLLADMRTGSNFLEENINQFNDLSCIGEAFNPHFIGYPNLETLLDMTLEERESAPERLLAKVKAHEGLAGFRLFHDHDERAFDYVMADPKCAKIILTRNPVDSFVSWRIASATGQWKLTNPTQRREQKVVFEPQQFEDYMQRLQTFQVEILNRLQRSGQTGFYISYDDLHDVEVMNGLAKFLGSSHQIEALSKRLKKQNPSAVSDKVDNFADMETALARMDQFNLSRTPNFEPRRGPMVPNFVAASHANLLFMPVRGAPFDQVCEWLAAVDGGTVTTLDSKFSQKTIRQWKRQHKGHRSFTVIRHPVARAYHAFCTHIFHTGPGSFREMRRTLRRVYNLPLPEHSPGPEFSLQDMKAAFKAFLVFLKANLNGQTALRVDPVWATQTQNIQGLTEFSAPDMIVREDRIEADLQFLASQTGAPFMPVPQDTERHLHDLADVYDEDIEALTRDAYQRDYMTYGFKPWSAS